MPADDTGSATRQLERTQVFTPQALALFMAQLLPRASADTDVLEPGAGAGALAEAVLDGVERPLRMTLLEKDPVFYGHLRDLIEHSPAAAKGSTVEIGDFFDAGAKWKNEGRLFDQIIMNPPYGKIRPNDPVRELVASHGIRTFNLYSAFLWLATDLLANKGTIVAIVPRSFLTGSQFAAAREHLFSNTTITALHHFTHRRRTFMRDAVQQEVVIFACTRNQNQDYLQYSQSEGLMDLPTPVMVPRERVLLGADEHFAVLTPKMADVARPARPSDIPLLPETATASVGSVVDFRVAKGIVDPCANALPLVGSEVFSSRSRNPRSVLPEFLNDKDVYPPGKYVVVRRISPAEARPRIQARALDLTLAEHRQGVAFENHLIVIHKERSGLSPEDCNLILRRLSSSTTERQFAERGGTTQVNLHDIKALRLLEEGVKHD